MEQHEARLAGERAELEAGEDFLGDEGALGAEKLHFDEVLVKPHVQRAEVLLHRVAPAEERQVQVNACSHKEETIRGESDVFVTYK